MKPDNLCQISSRSGLTGDRNKAEKPSQSPVYFWPSRISQIREFLQIYRSLALSDDLTWARAYCDELLEVSEKMAARADLAVDKEQSRGVVL